MNSPIFKDGFGIGGSLLRKGDDRHMRGQGQFVSDIRMPGLAEVAPPHSPHAHTCRSHEERR